MQHDTRIGSPWSGEAPVTLAEHRQKSVMQVSAFATDIAEASERLSAFVGLEPPAPNRYSGNSEKSIRNIGPGIWQIVGHHATSQSADTLRQQLQGVATVVDLTQARTTFRIQGQAARATLAKHCSLNLNLADFPCGSATMTRYGAVSVTLACIHEAPMFEVMVFRGYAEFILESLLNSASEYGLLINS
jgi:heterotetrameric sarcosine oxidase gamma subunit